MATIYSDGRSVFVSFGTGPYVVVTDSGATYEQWTSRGEAIPTGRDLDAALDESYEAGSESGYEHGWDEGYDAAMAKLYELLADVPEAIKILDVN